MSEPYDEILTLRQRKGAVVLMTYRGDW